VKFKNVVIESFAYELPKEILSTEALEARLAGLYNKLKLPQGRLELMTGIKERRLWPRGTKPSSLAALAGEKVLAKTRLKRADIGLLINGSVCRDFLEPATAALVHKRLGLADECEFFDLSNACLGVMSGITTMAKLIEGGSLLAGLVVAGENAGPLIEDTIQELLTNPDITRKSIKKYIANLTIGSAAVAYLICHKDLAPHGHRILGGASLTDSDAHELCQGSGDINSIMMETDSEKLLTKGVHLAQRTWRQCLENLGDQFNPDWVIGHQVGLAHEQLMLNKCALKNTKTYSTYETLGNTGAAALPLTLIKCAEDECLKAGDLVGLMGIGSGLSSVMLGVEW